MNFLDYLESGFQGGPVLTHGAIGPSFLTWQQQDFRAQRRRYGGGNMDDGSFFLSQVHFDKETGTASLGQLDVGPSGWYGTPHQSFKSCDCGRDPSCCA